MCGICGYIIKDSVDDSVLKSMNDCIAHRGPNDRGEEYFEQAGFSVGLGQVRLSILDLSPRGHQPMFSEDRRYCIVYNGEIYNYQELNTELKNDYNFSTTCDTETILAAYKKWGTDCVKHFNGMFSFAILDRVNDVIFFARDRMGKKPLYYWIKNDTFVFGSELKPIMKFPSFKEKIKTSILSAYLTNLYIAAPNTIFENVYKLESGSWMLYSLRNSSVKKNVYWDIWNVYKQESKRKIKNYSWAKEVLKQELKKAVKIRFRADVPIGVFLSGGYDSSLIAALAQSGASTPIHTYCIGMDGQTDETDFAEKIAKHLGTIHTNYRITEKDMLELVKSTPEFFDEPFADTSQIPMMLVAKHAKQDVTVVLSGDGGDEFFGGYGKYITVKRMQYLDLIGGLIYYLLRLVRLNDSLIEKFPYRVREIIKNRNKEIKTQCGQGDMIRKIRGLLLSPQMEEKFLVESQIPAKSWDIKRMLLDMKYYIIDDILQKVDRATMRYALEVRCPILDVNVMRCSFRIPQRYKICKKRTKKILKDIVYDYIPKELLERPKMGFGAPVDKWLRTNLREEVIQVSREEFLERQGIFEPQKTQAFVDYYLENGDGKQGEGKGYSYPIWAFYMFQLWWLKYIEYEGLSG